MGPRITDGSVSINTKKVDIWRFALSTNSYYAARPSRGVSICTAEDNAINKVIFKASTFNIIKVLTHLTQRIVH